MRLSKPLNEMLGNRTRVEILRMFYHYPGEFTGRQVARLCRLPQAPVQRQLQVLADNDLLKMKQFGRSKVFSLNNNNLLYPALERLFQAEKEILPKIEGLLRSAIKNSPYLRDRVVHASIYGSVAKREETSYSDLDLFLVLRGKFGQNIVDEQLEEVGAKIATVSGLNLHFFTRSLKDLNKINRELLLEIRESAILVYGEKLEGLQKWLRKQKDEPRTSGKKNSI